MTCLPTKRKHDQSSTAAIIDGSNISISGRQLLSRSGTDTKLNFRSLAQISCPDGNLEHGLIAFSFKHGTRTYSDFAGIREAAERYRLTVEFFTRDQFTSKEADVDEWLKREISVLCNLEYLDEICLWTGDGNRRTGDRSFVDSCREIIACGKRLRLCAFAHSCHRELRNLAEEFGEFIDLTLRVRELFLVANSRLVNLKLPTESRSNAQTTSPYQRKTK